MIDEIKTYTQKFMFGTYESFFFFLKHLSRRRGGDNEFEMLLMQLLFSF